jgi:hypothetical protein
MLLCNVKEDLQVLLSHAGRIDQGVLPFGKEYHQCEPCKEPTGVAVLLIGNGEITIIKVTASV